MATYSCEMLHSNCPTLTTLQAISVGSAQTKETLPLFSRAENMGSGQFNHMSAIFLHMGIGKQFVLFNCAVPVLPHD